MTIQYADCPSRKIIEEIFNSIIHGLGAIAGIIGLVIGLLTINSSASFRLSFIVYGVSLVALMLFSTLYHALIFTRAKKVFRILDYSGIFILIAGTYTPIIASLYQGMAQILFISGIWLIAIAGITINATLPKFMKRIGTLVYILFGWIGIALIPKLSLMQTSVLSLIIVGGVLYTGGVIFFASKKPFMHFSWHIFVITAACVQYFAIIKLA